MWFADVTARPFVTGVRIFGNELSEAFIQPTRNAIGIKTMQDKMNDLVAEEIVAELVGRIPLNEETAGGMNSTRPRFQFSENLKLLPFLRPLEDVDVRFDVARRLLPFQFLRDDAIMKFRFHRNWRGDITVNEMINEVLAL